MSIENWKLWLVPFGVWMVAMAWYTGYQSGYQEGHQTAWQMSRPSVTYLDGELMVTYDGQDTVGK